MQPEHLKPIKPNVGGRATYQGHPVSLPSPVTMSTTVNTPKHTDPATKAKEKANETEIKDKPSGKTVKTQKK